MRLFVLNGDQVESTWNDYRHLFEQFERATGEMTAEQVKAGAIDSTLQIWGLQDSEKVHGVVATEVIQTARGLICCIRAACGSAPRALQARLLDEIGRWARGTGCEAVRLVGRKGWLKRFPLFKQTGVVAEWHLRAN